MQTGWNWIDPVVSLIIAAVIFIGTWSLLRESLDLALHAVPEGIDPQEVSSYLAGLPGVVAEDEGLVLAPWSLKWLMARAYDVLLFPSTTIFPNAVHPIISFLGFSLNLVLYAWLIELAVNRVRSIAK